MFAFYVLSYYILKFSYIPTSFCDFYSPAHPHHRHSEAPEQKSWAPGSGDWAGACVPFSPAPRTPVPGAGGAETRGDGNQATDFAGNEDLSD